METINQLNDRLAAPRAAIVEEADGRLAEAYVAVREVDGELRVGFGTMEFVRENHNTQHGLAFALYYEIYKHGKLEKVVYNDYDRISCLGGSRLNLLPSTEPKAVSANPLFSDEPDEWLTGTTKLTNAAPLWWEIEREQKRAAFERMIALRNDVRRICGQGGSE